jgi:hypothetical protein
MGAAFPVGTVPKLYNEDPRLAELITIQAICLREQSKTAEKRWQPVWLKT